MQRIIALLIAVIFLSGCALTTIKAPKKKSYDSSSRRTTYEEPVYKPKPAPRKVVVEEKEEILPMKEEILPMDDAGVK